MRRGIERIVIEQAIGGMDGFLTRMMSSMRPIGQLGSALVNLPRFASWCQRRWMVWNRKPETSTGLLVVSVVNTVFPYENY